MFLGFCFVYGVDRVVVSICVKKHFIILGPAKWFGRRHLVIISSREFLFLHQVKRLEAFAGGIDGKRPLDFPSNDVEVILRSH